MYHTINENWAKKNNERNKTTKLGKQRTLLKKKILNYSNIGNCFHQTNQDKKKKKKNEETSGKQALQ